MCLNYNKSAHKSHKAARNSSIKHKEKKEMKTKLKQKQKHELKIKLLFAFDNFSRHSRKNLKKEIKIH